MKLFVSEAGSQEMVDFFNRSESRTLMVSVLAAVEVRSAIRRRHLADDIEADFATLAVATLVQETGRIVEHPINASVIAEAARLIDAHSIRALDSIQLASAIVARGSITLGKPILFVASDKRLLRTAELEGFSIWNPESSHNLF